MSLTCSYFLRPTSWDLITLLIKINDMERGVVYLIKIQDDTHINFIELHRIQ